METQHYPFTLQPLPYSYDALSPNISDVTLSFHHDKHLATYVENLNKALEKYPDYHEWSLVRLVAQYDHMPESIRTAVRNNAGGVYNHNLYFDLMTSPDQSRLNTVMADAIDKYFGSYQVFKEELTQAALTQFGSGWAYLVSSEDGELKIVKTPNQDMPLPDGLFPILLVDVWEHAYYLQYQNRRAAYVEKWFGLINWEKVAALYERILNNR